MVFDYCHKQGSLPFALVDDKVEEADSMNLLVVSFGEEKCTPQSELLWDQQWLKQAQELFDANKLVPDFVSTEEMRKKADLLVKITRERMKNHLK